MDKNSYEGSNMRKKMTIVFICWILSVSMIGTSIAQLLNNFHEPLLQQKRSPEAIKPIKLKYPIQKVTLEPNEAFGTFTSETTEIVSNETVEPESVLVKPFELARALFLQTHNESIVKVRSGYDEYYGFYWFQFLYLRSINGLEGNFTYLYSSVYYVNMTSGDVHKRRGDSAVGLLYRFVGKDPITSKEQANQTLLWLVGKSPFGWMCHLESRPSYRFALEENDSIGVGEKIILPPVQVKEYPEYYRVKGSFKNVAVCSPNVFKMITYNVYKNGTAVIVSPEYGIIY